MFGPLEMRSATVLYRIIRTDFIEKVTSGNIFKGEEGVS